MTSRSRSVRPCGSFKTTRKKSPPSTKNLPSDTPLECLVIYERINNIGGQFMKIVRLRPLLHAAILTIVCTTAGSAEEKITDTVSKQELQAKIEYCKTCHGLSGQG